jgi:hypothetical protein
MDLVEGPFGSFSFAKADLDNDVLKVAPSASALVSVYGTLHTLS